MNLLFVEDNENLQNVVGGIFKSWGIEYDIASNGKEALDLATCNEGKYDVCFMDTNMPVMNGLKATRAIRKKVSYFPILSTSLEDSYKNVLLKSGADDFILKPYDPEDLHYKITELANIRTFVIRPNDNIFEMKKEMPMDQKHAEEIKQLKEKGLIKMRLDGPELQEVIVHQNTPNKISFDFVVKKKLMTEFLNRDPDKPTICDLYRGNNNCVVETFLGEEDFIDKLASEDKEMLKHTRKYFNDEELSVSTSR